MLFIGSPVEVLNRISGIAQVANQYVNLRISLECRAPENWYTPHG